MPPGRQAGPVQAEAPSGPLTVGVDVGGTKLAAGLVAPDGAVLSRALRDTPAHDAAAIVRLIVEVVGELRGQELGPVPVGVGAPGIIDLDGVVRYAPNIRWADFPLRALLADALGVPVTVDNDGNVAAWGEYRAGAGGQVSSLAMLTIGTGVGGGLVLEDRLIRGGQGLGAEFGHIIVLEGGPRCGCGNRGCLEALASGNAIGRIAREDAGSGRIPASSPLAHPAGQLTGRVVALAARDGDDYARELLRRSGTWLGVGIASLVNALDPELVVVGGGAMQAGELLLGPAREAAVQRLMGRAHRRAPAIVAARLGQDAGVVGAALLASQAG